MTPQTDRIYQSQLIANTDLHAGGIFFGIIYRHCLLFTNDGQVIRTKHVIDPFRPMDPTDVKHLENYQITGTYYLNDRGYLICKFEEIQITLTGMFTEKDPGTLVVHAFDSRLGKQWSEIYSSGS